MSYRLATIVTDAPLAFNPEDNLRRPAKPELYQVFLRLEFHKLLEKMGLSAQNSPEPPTAASAVSVTVEQVTQEDQAQQLLAAWRAADHVSLLALADLSAVAVLCRTGQDTAVLAELFFSRYQGDWNGLLTAIFSADIKKVSHEVKDLIRTLLENNLPAEGFVFDTALAGYLLDATAGRYEINRLHVSYFSQELPPPLYLGEEAFSPLANAAESEAAFDSYVTAIDSLYDAMLPKLQEMGADALYNSVEMPLCRVLAEMELAGFRVDAQALRSLGEILTTAIETLEQKIYSYAGKFNINSPKQLGQILFEDLQMPHGKRTKTGWSTNADVLEKLRGIHPIVGEVLEYRHLCGRPLEGHPPRRPGAHQFPDDRHRHRTAELHRAQFAEHPHPHGAGQRAAADVRGG